MNSQRGFVLVSVLILSLILSMIVSWLLREMSLQIRLRQQLTMNIFEQQALRWAEQKGEQLIHSGQFLPDCIQQVCSQWQTILLPTDYPTAMTAFYQIQQWQPEGTNPTVYRLVTKISWQGVTAERTKWIHSS